MHTNRMALAFVVAVFLTLDSIGTGEPVSISHHLRTDSAGNDVNQLVPGDNVWFDLAVAVEAGFDPLNRNGIGNNGLATLVYDVTSIEAQAGGYNLNPVQDAFSGYSIVGSDINTIQPATISDPFYPLSQNSDGFGGGWGFDRAGLPGGGDVTTSPGSIIAAGIAGKLTWTADVNPNSPELQPVARPNVGHGIYTFVDDDPILGGHTGGFGLSVELGDPNVIVDGDGSWHFQTGWIDTTGWENGTYTFDVSPTAAALYDGALDYSQDIAGGFRLNVDSDDTVGTTSSFTLVPEPAVILLMLAGFIVILGRRRRV